MIKKQAHENPHRQIGTPNIGQSVGYTAAMADNLQSRGSGTQTKIDAIQHLGLDLLKHRIVSALHSRNGGIYMVKKIRRLVNIGEK